MSNLLELPPQIRKHERFHVVRDDLLPGGTKRRVLHRLVPGFPEDEIVYPSDPFGHGQYALALACADHQKRCTIISTRPTRKSELLYKTHQTPNVQVLFVEHAKHQSSLIEYAAEYASQNTARLMPIGFSFPEF